MIYLRNDGPNTDVANVASTTLILYSSNVNNNINNITGGGDKNSQSSRK